MEENNLNMNDNILLISPIDEFPPLNLPRPQSGKHTFNASKFPSRCWVCLDFDLGNSLQKEQKGNP